MNSFKIDFEIDEKQGSYEVYAILNEFNFHCGTYSTIEIANEVIDKLKDELENPLVTIVKHVVDKNHNMVIFK